MPPGTEAFLIYIILLLSAGFAGGSGTGGEAGTDFFGGAAGFSGVGGNGTDSLGVGTGGSAISAGGAGGGGGNLLVCASAAKVKLSTQAATNAIFFISFFNETLDSVISIKAAHFMGFSVCTVHKSLVSLPMPFFAYFAGSMWAICKKELRQFFSSLTGYIAIIVFLLVNGLMLFVFEDNILDFGYATLDRFFQLAPWVLLLLIPAITMRSFSDEFRSGTFELLQTRPLSRREIVTGKYVGCLIVVLVALLPTIIYFFSIQALSSNEGIDAGAAVGSYIGLFFLAAVFTSIGVCASSFTSNAVVSFIISLIACALLYYGFNAISRLFADGADYYIEMLGIDFHYRSISRGVIDTRDIVYFLSVIFLFLTITARNLLKR